MKVLIVEDTLTSAVLLQRHLEALGLETIHAQSGEEALAFFEVEKPDLVLLDIILPGIDGIEVARRMRAQEKDGEWTPIIYLSARHEDAAIEAGLAAGGDDYLVKPVSGVVLTAKLRAMQRLAQAQKSLLLLTRKLDEANRQLKRLTLVDGLTGIANRRAFDETLEQEWRRCQRNAKPLTLMLIDVDYFKRYNDRCGHQSGDDVLIRVAKTLESAMLRSADLVARYGGEEFAAICPETDLSGARLLAQRMVLAVENLRLPHPASDASAYVTCSIGGAVVTPGQSERVTSPATLLLCADRALYRTKDAGRNQTLVLPAEELMPS